jgi:SRSO17 transposase
LKELGWGAANLVVVVAAAEIVPIDEEPVGVAPEVKERLVAYMADVASGLGRVEQRRAAGMYARGLIEAGARKSLEPMVARLGDDADYEALQHFLADSPWDQALIERAVAERVCAVIDPQAWVLDDTGVVKDGQHSPGVKRQYSGTLGKTGNCQVTVSLHAVGTDGTVPLGFRLYLPEEWCADVERRRKAKIPDSVEFATKPTLGGELAVRAAGWEIARAPVLGDQAYGDDSKLRARLDDEQLEYVLSVSPTTTVFAAGTRFEIPPAKPGAGRPRSVPKADSEHTQVKTLAAALPAKAWQTVTYRDHDGQPVSSRFALVRVIAARPVTEHRHAPREEWLIIEWPEGKSEPTDYWLANLPADTAPERLARLARLRWMIELDYRQLKGELGLDHYEGRSYLGFHHHCAIVTAAHGFLTLERQNPNRQRPA